MIRLSEHRDATPASPPREVFRKFSIDIYFFDDVTDGDTNFQMNELLTQIIHLLKVSNAQSSAASRHEACPGCIIDLLLSDESYRFTNRSCY